MANRIIVLTGAAGLMGQVLATGLRDQYDLVGVDKHRAAHLPSRRVSITRRRRLIRIFAGADTVVHLAADPRLKAPWRSVFISNIFGTVSVLAAARAAGVRRVIFASSNAVTSGYEADEPWASVVAGRYEGLDPATFPRITAAMPVRPSGPYAVSKVFGEAVCRYYSDKLGLSTICVRIGTVNRDDRPVNPRGFATLLTYRDLVSLVRNCIEAPDDVRWALFYGVSANTWRLYDLAEAEQAVGFRPDDDAERWRT